MNRQSTSENHIFPVNVIEQTNLRKLSLVLLLLSTFLELGPIVLLINNRADVSAILFMGLCYQLGNLATSSIPLRGSHVIFILCLASIASLSFSIQSPELLYLSVGLTSLALQKTRRYVVAINPHPVQSISLKRSFAIAGFVASGFISVVIFQISIILILGITVFLIIRYRESWLTHPEIHLPKQNTLVGIMVIHQAHYFSYAYLIPLLVLSTFNIPVVFSGVLFVIGWLSDFASEPLFSKFDLRRTFILGHLLISVLLVIIGLFSNVAWIMLFAWFMTGFGGGTVFCLHRLNKQSEHKVDMEHWDNIGHVVGVLVSLVLSLTLDGLIVSHLFFLSAAVALSAALTMFKWSKTA